MVLLLESSSLLSARKFVKLLGQLCGWTTLPHKGFMGPVDQRGGGDLLSEQHDSADIVIPNLEPEPFKLGPPGEHSSPLAARSG